MKSGTLRIINVVLSLVALGTMLFYVLCTSTCSYFRGAIFGIDLKVVGVIFMVVLIILSLLKREVLMNLCLGAGLGGELILLAFQIKQGRFCPFCLIFGAVVIGLFLLNFKRSMAWYSFGAMVVGFLCFLSFFKGSFRPTFEISADHTWSDVSRPLGTYALAGGAKPSSPFTPFRS